MNASEVQEAEKTIPIWKWQDSRQQWHLYDEENMEKLETQYKKQPTGSCVVHRAEQACRVIFKQMQEKVIGGGTTTAVMREMVDEKTKNDLLAIEQSRE